MLVSGRVQDRPRLIVYKSGQISSRPKTRVFTSKGSFLEGKSPKNSAKSTLVKYYSIWPDKWNEMGSPLLMAENKWVTGVISAL